MDAVQYLYRVKGHVLNVSYSQTATTTVTTITPSNNISAYSIQNNSSSIAILVSVDGGTSYRTIVQLQKLVVDVKDTTSSLKIKTSSSTAGYDLEYTTIP